MSIDTPKKTGPAQRFLTELERILAVINEPSDVPGGKQETYQYHVLPDFLRGEVDLIARVFREYCGEAEPESQETPADDDQLVLL